MLYRLHVLLLGILWGFGLIQAADDFSDIDFLMEDYPPLNFVRDGENIGVTVEILQEIFNELNQPMPDLEVVPWMRGYHLVQSDKKVILLTMARTSSRENLVQWIGPLFTSRHLLVSYEGSGIKTYDVLVQKTEVIGAIKLDVTLASLQKHHYPENKIDLLQRASQLLDLLRPDRLKLISISENSFNELLKINNLLVDDFNVVAVTNHTQGYISASHAVDAQQIIRLQKALDRITERHLTILKSYGLKL